VTADSDSAFENALANGPVSIAIEADQDSFQMYTSGVFTGTCGDSLDHGVLAVGYGTDGSQQYWKVKNSWGDSWGESGYIRFLRDGGTIDSGHGQCGLLSQPSQPAYSGTGPTPTPPGPSPGPGPGPGPSPGPSGGDYSDPGTDGTCSNGDLAVSTVYDINGRMCMPNCTSSWSCPAAPSGWTGTPKCEYTPDSAEHVYCTIECTTDADCGNAATCTNVWDVFHICLYQ